MIEEIELNDKCKIETLKKSFPQLPVDIPVSGQSPINQFTHIFTISDKEEIVGCLILDIIYERMELVQIEVLESYRNMGYGKRLLEFMINEAGIRNLKNITLEVREDNNVAIHLYEKNGFQKVAIRKNYYHGTDGLLMERKMM